MSAVRIGRGTATREAILSVAECLFAEHGVHTVSNRHISEAAGQGNNAAVNYHFGTKADLVRAIIRKRTEPIERLRAELVQTITDPDDLREWVACLVRPTTAYLDQLGAPSWFARFSAQTMTDPTLRAIMEEEALTSPALVRTIAGIGRCLPDLPVQVRTERAHMARHLMIHMVAERERALAEATHTPRKTWPQAASGLIDGIVGLWLAPVTAR